MTAPAYDPNDPFEVAANPQPREYYGQFDSDSHFVVLQKGVKGGVPFDPGLHDPQHRRVSIMVSLTPLAEMNMTRTITRDMLDSDMEWYKFTLPSIKSVKLSNGRELKGRWGKCVIVETREDRGYKKTAIKVLAIYTDEAACRAEYLTKHGNGTQYGGGT